MTYVLIRGASPPAQGPLTAEQIEPSRLYYPLEKKEKTHTHTDPAMISLEHLELEGKLLFDVTNLNY